jgi:hypothetical protein
MDWDTADLTATVTGPAAGKVSAAVSYEDGGNTLLIDVTTDFVANDRITVSGLSFMNFTATSAADSLELEVYADDVVTAWDDKEIEILESTPAEDLRVVPTIFALETGSPNPFRRVTTIRYDIPVAGTARLAVYDVAGRLVRTLRRDSVSPGRHVSVWDGQDARGERVAAGVYFVRLDSGTFRATRKVVYLR